MQGRSLVSSALDRNAALLLKMDAVGLAPRAGTLAGPKFIIRDRHWQFSPSSGAYGIQCLPTDVAYFD